MDLDRFNRMDLEHIVESWEPVIEAAKAWRGEQRSYSDPLQWQTEQELDEAVEALQAAEGGVMQEDREMTMLEFANHLRDTNNRLVDELRIQAPVIEAAKALLVDDGTRLQNRIDRIVNATHALLEAME